MTAKYKHILDENKNKLYNLRWIEKDFVFNKRFYAKDDKDAIEQGKKLAPPKLNFEISVVLEKL